MKAGLILLICLFSSIGCAKNSTPTETGWQSFVSPEGSFSVALPGVPTQKSTPSSGNPLIITELYSAPKFGESYFSVHVKQFEKGSITEIGPQKYLNAAFEKHWRHRFGNLLESKRNLVVDGNPAIEFRGRLDPKLPKTTARMIVSKDRLFSLTTIMADEQLKNGDTERFFKSFHIRK